MLYNCTVDIRDGNFVLVKHRKIGDCLHLYILPIMQKLGGLEYLQAIVPTENSDRVFYGQKSRNSMRSSTQVGQKTAYYRYIIAYIFSRGFMYLVEKWFREQLFFLFDDQISIFLIFIISSDFSFSLFQNSSFLAVTRTKLVGMIIVV